MTTFVGKDVTFKIASVAVGYTQEISVEIDDGKKDIKELGSDGIVDYVWSQYAVSGSFSIIYTNYDLLTDVTASGTTKELSLEFDTTPNKYTVTVTNVKYGEYTITFTIDEPVTTEVSWSGEETSYTVT
jgi:hypothetical protein